MSGTGWEPTRNAAGWPILTQRNYLAATPGWTEAIAAEFIERMTGVTDVALTSDNRLRFTLADGSTVTTAVVPTVPGADGEVPAARKVLAGAGLTGGGDLSQDRTISLAPVLDARLTRTSNQTLASGGSAISWSTTPRRLVGASASGATLTINQATNAAVIEAYADWGWYSGSGINRKLEILRNGATVKLIEADYVRVLNDAGTAAGSLLARAVLDLAAGDTIQVKVTSNSANMAINAGATLTVQG